MSEFSRSQSGRSAETFVAEAEAKVSGSSYPWERADARIVKHFNLRLDEPSLEKLRFIAQHVPESMQGWARKILLTAIEEKIRELTEA